MLNELNRETRIQGQCAGCNTGNGEKLSSRQAMPCQTIKEAVAYFSSISSATSWTRAQSVLGTKNFLMEQLHLSLNELFLLALLWRTETLRGAVMSAFNFVCKTSYPNGKEETWIHQLGLVSHNTSHLFCFFLAWSACPASLNLPLAASFYHCCLILTFSLSLKSDVNCQGCKIGHEFSQLLNHTYMNCRLAK